MSDMAYKLIWHNSVMPRYKRIYQDGGVYFFTVNLQNRKSDLLIQRIDDLRNAIRKVKNTHPFIIHAWVVLPEHMHCIWELPKNNHDYPMRWRLIKSHFSRSVPNDEPRSNVRSRRKERGIWQYRFWEHLIRDETDFINHKNYIHYNPVKHGYVANVKDWEYSSFHKFVKSGVYQKDWGSEKIIQP